MLAQHEARLLNHNYIATEQLLLGLLREKEGLAACALDSLDITSWRRRSTMDTSGNTATAAFTVTVRR